MDRENYIWFNEGIRLTIRNVNYTHLNLDHLVKLCIRLTIRNVNNDKTPRIVVQLRVLD